MKGVYDGLTVVELADRRNQWAGKLLSDGGARVIQIEPTAGGPGRWCGPFIDDTVDPDRWAWHLAGRPLGRRHRPVSAGYVPLADPV